MSRAPLGVLLAGGAATRMGGRAKGLLPLGTGRVMDASLAALHAVCECVVIASNADDAATWAAGHEVVRDAVPGLGALGAIRTALVAGETHAAGTIVACAWDMPGVTATLLAACHDALVADDARDSVLPVHDGVLEPLCGAWRPRVRATCDAALAAGTRAVHAFVTSLRWHALTGEALASCGDAARLFLNVNTDDDLRVAAARLAR